MILPLLIKPQHINDIYYSGNNLMVNIIVCELESNTKSVSYTVFTISQTLNIFCSWNQGRWKSIVGMSCYVQHNFISNRIFLHVGQTVQTKLCLFSTLPCSWLTKKYLKKLSYLYCQNPNSTPTSLNLT